MPPKLGDSSVGGSANHRGCSHPIIRDYSGPVEEGTGWLASPEEWRAGTIAGTRIGTAGLAPPMMWWVACGFSTDWVRIDERAVMRRCGVEGNEYRRLRVIPVHLDPVDLILMPITGSPV